MRKVGLIEKGNEFGCWVWLLVGDDNFWKDGRIDVAKLGKVE